GQVAGLACGRRVLVAVRVALVAVHVLVRAVQGPARRGVIEAARRPAVGRVALRAVRRELRLLVVRLRRAVVIREVAGITAGGRAREPVGVALHAVHAGVLAREREVGDVVIEGSVVPGTFVMALCAIRREARRDVIGIRRAVVVGQVAGLACGRRVLIIPLVTLIAAHWNMATDQWPDRVIISGRAPARVRCVTRSAIRRETGRLVIRVRCGGEILWMTGDA